ncbi:regucalcin-like [Pieris brassicae]|uniref:Regucalcin n=1 Tax=Pieris brassicae TaxID=7116 RepID=A0A9P0TUS0_PIEBR|nr:regucalcin-like [Pieris brassicae]XP_045532197.1 regucalcin-like [Pieris brassicae]CAH4037887.1 unnamed protein product [Pieris brassicae]
MSVKLKKISEPLVLGEGPHWDESQQALFFVDILDCCLHKYIPATGEWTKAKIDGGRVGFVVPVEGSKTQFIVGVEKTFKIIEWDGKADVTKDVKVLGSVDQDVDATRINDGKADPRGRIFAGTMGQDDPPGVIAESQGSFYRLDNDGNIKKLCSGIGISNGLAWDIQEKAMYYTDSLEHKIRKYDYNIDTGDISNLKYIFDFKKAGVEGTPDGTTIDTDGNLWIAVFNGSCVIKIDPRTGTLLQKVPIPALQVTSVIFGGPNYDVLFVTSAKINVEGKQQPPSAGCTFMVTGLGVKGLPGYNFRLN